jgi:hypothetical protein
MPRALWFVLLVTVAGISSVQAQTAGPAGDGNAARHKPAGLLNENYLTPTGQTVPRPGLSQGAPPSALDRRIEDKDNRIEQSICSNCN